MHVNVQLSEEVDTTQLSVQQVRKQSETILINVQ